MLLLRLPQTSQRNCLPLLTILAIQDWRWQQRGKRQKGERPPIAAPSYGEPLHL